MISNAARFLDSIRPAFEADDPEFAAKNSEAENVRLVEEVHRRIADGDFDGLRPLLDDDAKLVIYGPPEAPFAGEACGADAVVAAAKANFAAVDDQRVEIRAVVAQDRYVVVFGEETGRVRSTGREYHIHWTYQYKCRDGKIRRVRGYVDTATLMKAFQS